MGDTRVTLKFPNRAGRNLELTDQITLKPNRDGIYAFEDENGRPFTQEDGLVFLTGVTGKFEGHGELIRIRTADSTNHWVAEVKSGQHGNNIEAVAFVVALKF